MSNCRFIRMPELRKKVGLSRSQIYRLIQCDQFPSPIKVGPRISVWSEISVDQWMGEVEGQARATN